MPLLGGGGESLDGVVKTAVNSNSFSVMPLRRNRELDDDDDNVVDDDDDDEEEEANGEAECMVFSRILRSMDCLESCGVISLWSFAEFMAVMLRKE
jgi:hypothetical protein